MTQRYLLYQTGITFLQTLIYVNSQHSKIYLKQCCLHVRAVELYWSPLSLSMKHFDKSVNARSKTDLVDTLV